MKGCRRDNGGALLALVFILILLGGAGAAIYFYGIPFYKRLALEYVVEGMLMAAEDTKSVYSRAITTVDTTAIKEEWKPAIKERIIDKMTSRWEAAKLEIKRRLSAGKIGDARGIHSQYSEILRFASKEIDLEIDALGQLLSKISAANSTEKYENEIKLLPKVIVENPRNGAATSTNDNKNDDTVPELTMRQKYAASAAKFKRYYNNAQKNRSDSVTFKANMLMALAYDSYIKSEYQDYLDREFFQTRRQLKYEKKPLGSHEEARKFSRSRISELLNDAKELDQKARDNPDNKALQIEKSKFLLEIEILIEYHQKEFPKDSIAEFESTLESLMKK